MPAASQLSWKEPTDVDDATARLSSGPYFSYFSLLFLSAPTFPYFFMKVPYYPYFFTLKCHLHQKIQNFLFLARLARSDFLINLHVHSGSTPLNTSIFNV